MSDEGYNGWKNYPTWAVHLWLTNDQGWDDLCWEKAANALSDEHPRYTLATDLKHTLREEYEPESADLASDLLGYALDCVDWYEIADAWLEVVREGSEIGA